MGSDFLQKSQRDENCLFWCHYPNSPLFYCFHCPNDQFKTFQELLVLSKWICICGVNISGSIFLKLFRIRKRSNIINTLFLVHIFITSVLVPFRIFTFFQLGYSHFVRDQSDYEEDIQTCKFYIVTSATNLMFSICINTGMVFCRFIYVRYAKGLLSMGSNMFHGLVYLVICIYFLDCIFMFPVRNFFLMEDVDLNNIQKRVCTKTNITWYKDDEQNKQFSLQPKLLIFAFSNMILFFNLFFSTSAHRQTKRYRIPKTRINLMTMKQQSQYLTIHILVLVSDQVLFIIFQAFYDQLGVDNIFVIWWIFHFLEIVFIHIVLDIWIYINATRYFEEFNGYNSTRYPGQEKPHQAVIRPRRPSHSKSTDFILKL